jgi:rubrerythrin
MKNDNQSITIKNLEAAFAGESMAHIKYLHFAKVARLHGDEATAKVFEDTARQEVMHALGHADLLYPKDQLSVQDVLQYAIEGETYEYTEMYPTFRHEAEQEGNMAAVKEMDEQISESKEHAEMFADVLAKAERRFAALTKVEEKHANNYKAVLANVQANQ